MGFILIKVDCICMIILKHLSINLPSKHSFTNNWKLQSRKNKYIKIAHASFNL